MILRIKAAFAGRWLTALGMALCVVLLAGGSRALHAAPSSPGRALTKPASSTILTAAVDLSGYPVTPVQAAWVTMLPIAWAPLMRAQSYRHSAPLTAFYVRPPPRLT